MKQFANLEQLKDAFKHKRIQHLDPEMEVDGIPYKFFRSTQTAFKDVLVQPHKAMVVYATESKKREKAASKGLNDWLVFAWVADGLSIVPSNVMATPKHETSQPLIASESVLVREMDVSGTSSVQGEPITLKPEQVIGDTINVEITSIPNSKQVQAKVDTGATISSLDAEEWHIQGDRISFKSKALSDNTLTMPLKTQHAVKSADGGTHYRPVVELSIKINGKQMENQLFNLNDRSNMEQPILIGQNILKAGKFFINPVRESVELSEVNVDWVTLSSVVEAMDPPTTNPDAVRALYETMLKEDVNFRDLIKFIRTEITTTFEDIKY